MKILIIGAGIGGLSLASFCEKTKIDYVIIEREKDFSHHGYSLGLWSNARNMLEKLGLQDKFDEVAIPFKTFKFCNGEGKKILEYEFSDFFTNYGMGYFHVHRNDLINWLSSGLNKKILFDKTVKDIKENENSVEVIFSDDKSEIFDLVVACDGVGSQVREKFFKEDCRVFENWRSWFMWIDSRYVDKKSMTEYVEPGSFIIAFYEEGDKALININLKQDHKIFDDENGRIDRLKKLFKDYQKLVPYIFEGKKSNEVLPTNLSYIKLDKMYKGRIVLLGDSAHGFHPFAGLGASMAMEDAYVLTAELNKQKNIKEALSNYQKKRKARIKEAVKVTMRMRKFLIVESKILRLILNFLIPLLPKSFFINSYKKLLNKEI